VASVTATSSIPPPAPLKLGKDVASDWERFRSEWRNYETATELDKTTEKRRSAISLASVGSAAHTVFGSFKFDEEEDRTSVDKIIEAFDNYCIGETNVIYERHLFHQRVQQPGETISYSEREKAVENLSVR